MDKDQDTRLPLTSADIVGERMEALRELFPEVFAEGKVDFEKLKQAIGEFADDSPERYGLSWAGKSEAKRAFQSLSSGTLAPMRAESVNFDTTENLIIQGDNLEVLKLLQQSYHGKVKMIYIDPPYNTGKEFIYPDNFREGLDDYLKYSGQVSDEGFKVETNTETSGRFHSKWLNMMYPRLFLARNLLSENGVIFVSIADQEAHNVRHIMDEIFGPENFIAQFVWNTEGHTDNQFQVKVNHEYVLLYARNGAETTLGYIVDPNTRTESNLWKGYAENSITKNGSGNPPSEVGLPTGFPCAASALDLPPTDLSADFYAELDSQGYITRAMTDRHDVTYPIRKDRMVCKEGKLAEDCRVFSGWANVNKLKAFIQNKCQPITDADGCELSFYLSERGVIYYRREREQARNILSVIRNVSTTEQMRSELEGLGIEFQYPKPKELLKYLIRIGCGYEGTVLDFFSGSGTMAQAVLEQNNDDGGDRSFILVQLPEPTDNQRFKTIADLCKERVRRVISKLNKDTNDTLRLGDDGKQDRGFKALKLTSSNFKLWNADTAPTDAEGLAEQLSLYADHLLPGRSQEDILYELLLKAGVSLGAKIAKVEVAGRTAFDVSEGLLLICLEDEVTEENLRAMIQRKPEQVLCLDNAFKGNDQLKTNTVLEMKSHDITFHTV